MSDKTPESLRALELAVDTARDCCVYQGEEDFECVQCGSVLEGERIMFGLCTCADCDRPKY